MTLGRWACFWFVCTSVMPGSAASVQAPEGPRFEVASVKENRRAPGPDAPARVVMSGDRVTITNETLHTMLRVAFPGAAEVRGGPTWVGSPGPPRSSDVRFDVLAKAAGPATRDELQQMLRALLLERFSLAFHTETMPESIWELVVARRDRKLGPHLRPARADCDSLRAEAKDAQTDPCGTLTMANALLTGVITVRGLGLDMLGILGRDVGRTVVDKTGLTGSFDWELKWTPQVFLQGPFDRERFRNIDPDGPSLFRALEEQLGLKLVSAQAQKEVLVIERAERPSEN